MSENQVLPNEPVRSHIWDTHFREISQRIHNIYAKSWDEAEVAGMAVMSYIYSTLLPEPTTNTRTTAELLKLKPVAEQLTDGRIPDRSVREVARGFLVALVHIAKLEAGLVPPTVTGSLPNQKLLDAWTEAVRKADPHATVVEAVQLPTEPDDSARLDFVMKLQSPSPRDRRGEATK